MEVTLNPERQQFVISLGRGHSYLDFKAVFEQSRELARRLLAAGRHVQLPEQAEFGTLAQYAQRQQLLAEYATLDDQDLWFDARTPAPVREVLEQYLRSRRQIRLFLGNPATGRDSLWEQDIIGRIGRSEGPLRVPRMIGPLGRYGGAISTEAVVRMVDVDGDYTLWQHPQYHLPAMRVGEAGCFDDETLTHGIWVEEENGTFSNRMNFKCEVMAQRYLAFLKGERHIQPRS